MAYETITGYCWPQSTEAGGRVDLRLSSPGGRPARVEVGDHPTPHDASRSGCDWPTALSIDVDRDWRSGFYEVAFGWEFNDYGPAYAGIKGPEREVGGLRQGEPVRGGPLVVLYSDDLDASLEAVRAAGGGVVKEPFAFPGGRRFHFTDPSGNELAVWGSA